MVTQPQDQAKRSLRTNECHECQQCMIQPTVSQASTMWREMARTSVSLAVPSTAINNSDTQSKLDEADAWVIG